MLYEIDEDEVMSDVGLDGMMRFIKNNYSMNKIVDALNGHDITTVRLIDLENYSDELVDSLITDYHKGPFAKFEHDKYLDGIDLKRCKCPSKK